MQGEQSLQRTNVRYLFGLNHLKQPPKIHKLCVCATTRRGGHTKRDWGVASQTAHDPAKKNCAENLFLTLSHKPRWNEGYLYHILLFFQKKGLLVFGVFLKNGFSRKELPTLPSTFSMRKHCLLSKYPPWWNCWQLPAKKDDDFKKSKCTLRLWPSSLKGGYLGSENQ